MLEIYLEIIKLCKENVEKVNLFWLLKVLWFLCDLIKKMLHGLHLQQIWRYLLDKLCRILIPLKVIASLCSFLMKWECFYKLVTLQTFWKTLVTDNKFLFTLYPLIQSHLSSISYLHCMLKHWTPFSTILPSIDSLS